MMISDDGTSDGALPTVASTDFITTDGEYKEVGMRAQLMFTVQERRETAQTNGKKVGGLKLGPIYPQPGHPLEEEMKRFYAWTPGGQIDFTTVNEDVLDSFPPGTICRITIEPYEEVMDK